MARNAIARVTPDDVTCYVALPFDERLIGGWRRKGRAAPELMEAPPSEAESEKQAAGAEPSTTCPRLVFRSRASSAGIIGGRRSGRRRSGRLPERKRSSCPRRSALAEAAHPRGDRLRDQDGSDDLGHESEVVPMLEAARYHRCAVAAAAPFVWAVASQLSAQRTDCGAAILRAPARASDWVRGLPHQAYAQERADSAVGRRHFCALLP